MTSVAVEIEPETGESLRAWANRMDASAPSCRCGCGDKILVKADHRSDGIPDFIRGHATRLRYENLDAWVAEQQGQHRCACGCGRLITIRRWHRCKGIPPCIKGHGHSGAQNANYKGVDAWVEAQQGRHTCACGCARPIIILKQHYSAGIPRFLIGHGPGYRYPAGENHPKYVRDRSKAKSRRGQYFIPSVRRFIFERCGNRCVRCGATERLDCDHVRPVALGGEATVDNGQVLCRTCHRLKSRVDRERARLEILDLQIEVRIWRALYLIRQMLEEGA